MYAVLLSPDVNPIAVIYISLIWTLDLLTLKKNPKECINKYKESGINPFRNSK
jgi:hypothetical protein